MEHTWQANSCWATNPRQWDSGGMVHRLPRGSSCVVTGDYAKFPPWSRFFCLILLSRKGWGSKGSFWAFCFLVTSLKINIPQSKTLVPLLGKMRLWIWHSVGYARSAVLHGGGALDHPAIPAATRSPGSGSFPTSTGIHPLSPQQGFSSDTAVS